MLRKIKNKAGCHMQWNAQTRSNLKTTHCGMPMWWVIHDLGARKRGPEKNGRRDMEDWR